MSYRYFRDSSLINRSSRLLNRLEKIGILDGRADYQVHRAVEKLFQRFQQTEVGISILTGRQWQELHYEIQVTVLVVSTADCGRTKQVETLNMVQNTKLLSLVSQELIE